MKYTIRQTRFVTEYLVDGNGAQAAVRAGYSVKCAKEQAYRLLTYVHISVAIEQKRSETARISGLSAAGVVKGLIDAVEQAKTRGDAKSQITAWREIAKILGFYPATTKSSGRTRTGVDPTDIQTWPEEELCKFETVSSRKA